MFTLPLRRELVFWGAGHRPRDLRPGGHALLGVFHDRKEDNPFGEGSRELLRLILPALHGGLHMLDSLHERATVLESALDAVDEALLLCDGEGRELHRNRSLRRLLEAEPDREPLERGSYALRATYLPGAHGAREAGHPFPQGRAVAFEEPLCAAGSPARPGSAAAAR